MKRSSYITIAAAPDDAKIAIGWFGVMDGK